ncbi:sulfite exporter TauE/SafE family protein [Nocardioides panacisoli]|uniref:Probable membrane transporter protein n=1 Tax=Nocardioides panacisoli TaxID=627624 RepID=A0ABP7I3B3_9ACTN
MPYDVEGTAFLTIAGVVAGVVGTAGGITSLVSYPALLAVGISPLTANVTNSVALLGSGASSATRAAPDVTGHGETIRRFLPISIVLSLAGAVVLVLTPGRVFDRIVPFLVAAGALIVLLQPRISRWQEHHEHSLGRGQVLAGLSCVALYNGYFGAGSGILLVALLMLTVEPVLHRANSMKNVVLVASDVLPAVLFAVLGTVVWSAAIPLGVGAVVGGLLGPAVARRTRPDVLRVLIACCGFALAAWLLLNP